MEQLAQLFRDARLFETRSARTDIGVHTVTMLALSRRVRVNKGATLVSIVGENMFAPAPGRGDGLPVLASNVLQFAATGGVAAPTIGSVLVGVDVWKRGKMIFHPLVERSSQEWNVLFASSSLQETVTIARTSIDAAWDINVSLEPDNDNQYGEGIFVLRPPEGRPWNASDVRNRLLHRRLVGISVGNQRVFKLGQEDVLGEEHFTTKLRTLFTAPSISSSLSISLEVAGTAAPLSVLLSADLIEASKLELRLYDASNPSMEVWPKGKDTELKKKKKSKLKKEPKARLSAPNRGRTTCGPLNAPRLVQQRRNAVQREVLTSIFAEMSAREVAGKGKITVAKGSVDAQLELIPEATSERHAQPAVHKSRFFRLFAARIRKHQSTKMHADRILRGVEEAPFLDTSAEAVEAERRGAGGGRNGTFQPCTAASQIRDQLSKIDDQLVVVTTELTSLFGSAISAQHPTSNTTRQSDGPLASGANDAIAAKQAIVAKLVAKRKDLQLRLHAVWVSVAKATENEEDGVSDDEDVDRNDGKCLTRCASVPHAVDNDPLFCSHTSGNNGDDDDDDDDDDNDRGRTADAEALEFEGVDDEDSICSGAESESEEDDDGDDPMEDDGEGKAGTD